MKKKVDFLIVYETRVRELENVCLLKYELERRGYSVAIINTWNSIVNTKKNVKYDAKVVITPSMYNDGIYDFMKSIVGNMKKIVNLQWEQIGTIGDEKRQDSRFVLKGMASQCMNICWGDVTVNRLLNKSGFDKKHIRKTGQIALDFCSKRMRNYYEKREQLFEKYNINLNYEVNLFISSFSYVNLPEYVLNQSQISDKSDFIKISIKSFDSIIDWFQKMLTNYPNQAIIYRPHPAEATNKKLLRMEKMFGDRFKVISERSVKQWIIVVDRVYTWYSTSAAEAYMCDVPCAILRPVEIPEILELQLYEDAKFIKNFDEFIGTLHNVIQPSLSETVFNKCYDVKETLSYIRVADVVEETLKNPEYLIHDKRKKLKKSLFLVCKEKLYFLISWTAENVFKNIKSLEHFRNAKNIDDYTYERCKNNYADEETIKIIQEKIKCVLERK